MEHPLPARTALAAILVLVAAAGLVLLVRDRGTGGTPFPPRYVNLDQPKGEVAETPVRFTWQPVDGASRYRVTIEDADTFWPLVLGTSDVPAFDLPEERGAIRPGRIHEWSVEALDAGGATIAWGGARFWIGPGGESVAAVAPGSTLPFPLLLRRLDGTSVDPIASGSPAVTVLLLCRTDCPVDIGYAPELRRLAEVYAPKGVAMYLVFVDPAETPGSVGRHLADYSLPLTPLLDPGHELARVTGVSVTPAAVVVSGDRRLIYRGRIDDRYPESGSPPREPSVHDLALALDALLAGRTVERAGTEAIGCPIGAAAPLRAPP